MKPLRRTLGAAALAAALTAACGGGGGGGGPQVVPPTAEELAEAGWDRFAAADYDSAAALFAQALATDENYADAWHGAGWSGAYLGLLAAADSAFAEAIERGASGAAPWCGLAAVDRDLPDLASAAAAADSALARDPLFIFSRRPSVDSLDLHLLRGQIQLARGAAGLAEAQAEADFLQPGNGLDPGTPASWVVGGDTLAAYSQALVRLLELLAAEVGGDLP